MSIGILCCAVLVFSAVVAWVSILFAWTGGGESHGFGQVPPDAFVPFVFSLLLMVVLVASAISAGKRSSEKHMIGQAIERGLGEHVLVDGRVEFKWKMLDK